MDMAVRVAVVLNMVLNLAHPMADRVLILTTPAKLATLPLMAPSESLTTVFPIIFLHQDVFADALRRFQR